MLVDRYLNSYKQKWIGKSIAQVAEEIASLSMESKRIPDPYTFLYNDNGKLVSPETGQLVDGSIDKVSALGKIEYEGFLFVEKMGWQNESGVLVWISPPHYLRSNFTKVVVTEIKKGEHDKRLFNRAMLFDLNNEECVSLANSLTLDNVYQNVDQVRRQPVFIHKGFAWDCFLDKRQTRMITRGEDLKEKNLALVKSLVIAEDLSKLNTLSRESQIFGMNDISCPPTAFQSFSGEKRILCCKCPYCGKQVEAEIFSGKIHCPECRKSKLLS